MKDTLVLTKKRRVATMGRRKGGKNFGNFVEEKNEPILVYDNEMQSLPNIFTSINKDFITIDDLINSSGLSYDTCARVIREIKAVSDVFKISGVVHRTDYYLFLSRRFNKIKLEATPAKAEGVV
jgi:hypothetical protein